MQAITVPTHLVCLYTFMASKEYSTAKSGLNKSRLFNIMHVVIHTYIIVKCTIIYDTFHLKYTLEYSLL